MKALAGVGDGGVGASVVEDGTGPVVVGGCGSEVMGIRVLEIRVLEEVGRSPPGTLLVEVGWSGMLLDDPPGPGFTVVLDTGLPALGSLGSW